MFRAVVDILLALLLGQRCPGCGAPTSVAPCASCRQAMRDTPGATDAAWLDVGVVARLVRCAKHGRWRAGGAVLARFVVAERRAAIPQCDVVAWVPADRRRRAERGGHLPARAARELGRRLGVPVVGLLAPVGSRRPQRGLDREARLANVAGAFRPTAAALRLRPGSRVLVLDDVRTTGATLDAARSALGDLDVRVEVLAIVGVDRARRGWRPIERSLGAANSCSGIEPSVPIRGGTLPKGSSLRAPRPP